MVGERGRGGVIKVQVKIFYSRLKYEKINFYAVFCQV